MKLYGFTKHKRVIFFMIEKRHRKSLIHCSKVCLAHLVVLTSCSLLCIALYVIIIVCARILFLFSSGLLASVQQIKYFFFHFHLPLCFKSWPRFVFSLHMATPKAKRRKNRVGRFKRMENIHS